MTTVFRYTSPLVAKAALYLGISKLPFYVGYGKATAWDSTWGTGVTELNPPVPSEKLMELPDPLLYKRCVSILPVIERNLDDSISFTTCGEFEDTERSWLVLDVEKTPAIILRELNVDHLLVTCELEPEEAPESFRTFGLFIDPIPKEGVQRGLVSYLPNQLSSPGLPVVFCYCTAVPSVEGNKFVNKFLIKI